MAVPYYIFFKNIRGTVFSSLLCGVGFIDSFVLHVYGIFVFGVFLDAICFHRMYSAHTNNMCIRSHADLLTHTGKKIEDIWRGKWGVRKGKVVQKKEQTDSVLARKKPKQSGDL